MNYILQNNINYLQNPKSIITWDNIIQSYDNCNYLTYDNTIVSSSSPNIKIISEKDVTQNTNGLFYETTIDPCNIFIINARFSFTCDDITKIPENSIITIVDQTYQQKYNHNFTIFPQNVNSFHIYDYFKGDPTKTTPFKINFLTSLESLRFNNNGNHNGEQCFEIITI